MEEKNIKITINVECSEKTSVKRAKTKKSNDMQN